MKISYREMSEADAAISRYIARRASDALNASIGLSPGNLNPGFARYIAHIIRSSPSCNWVAEGDGFAVGFSCGFVRDEVWNLSQLFVYPEYQAAGVGRQLLQRSVEGGRALGARVLAVCASPSLAAQALYVRAGMHPRGLLYRLEGPCDALLALALPADGEERVADFRGWLDRIDDLDRLVWGACRRQDHEFYLSAESIGDGAQSAFALSRDGDLLGYGYALVDTDGVAYIGPLAAKDPLDQLSLLRVAGDWLVERSAATVRAAIVSHNGIAISALLGVGWRISGSEVFLASEPFGQFDRYVTAGGALL